MSSNGSSDPFAGLDESEREIREGRVPFAVGVSADLKQVTVARVTDERRDLRDPTELGERLLERRYHYGDGYTGGMRPIEADDVLPLSEVYDICAKRGLL